MNFIGKITNITDVKTGKTKKGDDWASLDFEVTESEPNNPDYPQITLFSFFKSGEYFKMANEFAHKVGDEVLVDFNFKRQVYQKKDGSGEGRFYKNDCWRVVKTEQDSGAFETTTDINDDEGDPLPF